MEHSTQLAAVAAAAVAAPAPAAAHISGSSGGLQDPKVQAALLRHPSVSQHQQVVLALLQASKQLQVAVAERCAGQVPAVLQLWRLQQALCFAQRWLPKHGGLLRELEVHLEDDSNNCITQWLHNSQCSDQAVEALAAALEQQQQQQLQAFVLHGAPAGPILQHMPAACLTRLCAGVYFGCDTTSSLAAVAHLTALRSLDLCDSKIAEEDPYVLEDVGSLQQLTELCIGPVRPDQLQLLMVQPPLQQLHVSVDVDNDPACMEELADWLEQHGSLVRRLKLCSARPGDCGVERWAAAVGQVAAALQVVGSAPPAELPAGASEKEAAAAAAVAPVVATATSHVESCLQLQSFVMQSCAYGILQCLPASRLTHLQCGLDYSSAQQWSALCALTALRSLCLYSSATGRFDLDEQPSDVLAPLSALKQLTKLYLDNARGQQLQLLPAWLHELGYLHRRRQRLQLQHLTALSLLYVQTHALCGELRAGDVLPPNLRILELQCLRSVQPLLALSRLESLSVIVEADGVAAAELQQLSSLSQLADVQLRYKYTNAPGTAAVGAAWQALPLRSLQLHGDLLVQPLTFSAAVVQRLSALQGLTHLELDPRHLEFGQSCWPWLLEATPAQLAAALHHLTALRWLEVLNFKSMLADGDSGGVSGSGGEEQPQNDAAAAAAYVAAVPGFPVSGRPPIQLPAWQDNMYRDIESDSDGYYDSGSDADSDSDGGGVEAPQHSAAGVAACVEVVCGLPALARLRFELPVRLDSIAQQQLASITATQPLQLNEFTVDGYKLSMVMY